MPELPEVETVARILREGRLHADGSLAAPPLTGRTILETRVLWRREIQGLTTTAFVRQTVGRRVTSIGRHGKYLIIGLSAADRGRTAGGSRSAGKRPQGVAALAPPLSMLIHLRMSGRLDVVPQAEALSKHARVVWLLDGGWALRFDDARKFGRILLVDDLAGFIAGLGPDALQIDSAEFTRRLRRRKGALKPLLLDQSFIAGVGNIYADEALFQAGLHPQRLSQSLADGDIARLHSAIQQMLRDGIAANGASFDWVYPGGNYQESFRVYGRAGQPCPNCGSPIVRLTVGQRGTHVCPQCQRRE